MRKQQHQEVPTVVIQHLWTYAEAVNALPYLRALVRSLREHWLELQQARLRARRLDARTGRSDRQALILREEVGRELEMAQEHWEEVVGELTALDVYLDDPARGLALIPFAQGDVLAWYVFDLFAPLALVGWRFDTDSPDTRRSLVANSDPALAARLSVFESLVS